VAMSPEQQARVAALTRWSREDPGPSLAKVRLGFLRRFEDQVDPERGLSDSERAKRAHRAMRAHMLTLAAKSAASRAKAARR
jgi:hypothetical protein